MTVPFQESTHIEILPDDVFLVSYPKSGRTWLRFLIGNYLTNNQWDFPNSYRNVVADIDFNPLQCCQLQRPRFITSHMPFTPEYKKVVYIVRDGRDVAVSYYFHMMKFREISKETPFKDFILDFNHGSLIHQTTWSDHVNLWLDNAPDDFLLVKYEDLKLSAFHVLLRILEFAGLSADLNTVIAAVKASEFNQLKAYERLQEKVLFEEVINSDLSIPFFRKGQVGDYKNFFSDELMRDFLDVHGSSLERLGYSTSKVFNNSQSKKIKDLEAVLQQAESNLKNAQSHKYHLELELEKAQFKHSQFELELEQAQIKQNQFELELEKAQIKQNQLTLELEKAKVTITGMESSKFWKIRTYWLKIKKLFKIVSLD